MSRKNPAVILDGQSGVTEQASRRLKVLELARELGNAAEACRRCGVGRTSFYRWKRRFETLGIEGLEDEPPVHHSHPQTTSPEIAERIRDLSLAHPANGCNRLEEMLSLEGVTLSYVTIQKILNEQGLGTRTDRWLALEALLAQGDEDLTPRQLAFVERLNPAIRERDFESAGPGQILVAGTWSAGKLAATGKVFIHAVVDTFGSYAFAALHGSRQAEATVGLLDSHVLPFYRELNLPVTSLLTGDGSEFDELVVRPFEEFLDLNGILHRKSTTPGMNGYLERFKISAMKSFFRVNLRKNHYRDIDALQADLDDWLNAYNTQLPHPGYRNMGRSPFDVILSAQRRSDV